MERKVPFQRAFLPDCHKDKERLLIQILNNTFKKNNASFDGRAKREQSLEELRRHLYGYYIPLKRQFLVLFPEGGFLHKRREVSQRFAEKNNLPRLEYVSLPRAGAMRVIMEEVGPFAHQNNLANERSNLRADRLEWILDVTIAYEDRVPLHLKDIVCGTRAPCVTHLHYRLYPSTDVPEDVEGMTRWLYDRFIEKDKMLEEFYRTGKFPSRNPSKDTVRRVQQDNLRYVILHLFFLVSTLIQLRVAWWLLGFVW
ncbi:Acyl-CoA:lysophosphatidylglycerol acyltransferase 1 [Eumeta japonica]|uniref:Acyl-CoA:lysophosphatidylglycerol acyltransferase 1 n=1 Tax=Eumeta variegata TaxID=151549 RepID=A0A4C1V6Y5_EUMVA|nr:Acyl-CoA:lysophosphatidylglycerol acyltransferase 1 [Eumeta japonica]